MTKFAVFASGSGTNFAALAAAAETTHAFEIVQLVCDRPQAGVIAKAKQLQIPTLVLDFHAFTNKAAFETAILEQLLPVDGLLLAGYMRIIGPTLLAAFPQCIVNIHPALLPLFPGRHGIEDAFAAGVKQTGVTIHFVDAGIDTGQIIAQREVPIPATMTLPQLEQAIHTVEHSFYPQTVTELVRKGVFA